MRSHDVVTDYQYLTRVLLFGVMTDGYKDVGKILRKMELNCRPSYTDSAKT